MLPHNTVRSLFVSSDGALRIGTDNGLVRKFNNGYTYFFEEDGLPTNNIWAITEDEAGIIWVGTYGNGIAFFENKKFTPLSRATIHEEITTLLTHKNHLFIGTSNGLSVINIKRNCFFIFYC